MNFLDDTKIQIGIIIVVIILVSGIIYKRSMSPTTKPPSMSPTTKPPSMSPTTKPPSMSPTTKPPSMSPTTKPPSTSTTTKPPSTSTTPRPPITLPPTPPTTTPPTTTPPTTTTLPIDCIVSDWRSPGPCEGCNPINPPPYGIIKQRRSIEQQPSNGGKACPELEKIYKNCECPVVTVRPANPLPIDCVVGDWSSWGTCSAACGGGTQKRTKSVITPSQNGGNVCPLLEESQGCNTQSCPTNEPSIDCFVSDWSSWGTCSAACGGGTQKRTKYVITPSQNGGRQCPSLEESQGCNTQACPTAVPLSRINCCDTYCDTYVDVSRYPYPQGYQVLASCKNKCIDNPVFYRC